MKSRKLPYVMTVLCGLALAAAILMYLTPRNGGEVLDLVTTRHLGIWQEGRLELNTWSAEIKKAGRKRMLRQVTWISLRDDSDRVSLTLRSPAQPAIFLMATDSLILIIKANEGWNVQEFKRPKGPTSAMYYAEFGEAELAVSDLKGEWLYYPAPPAESDVEQRAMD